MVDEIDERTDFEFNGTEMVKGVEFAELEDEGDLFYVLVYPDGRVHREVLQDPRSRGNFTLATRESDGREVMVDDDGIHEEW